MKRRRASTKVDVADRPLPETDPPLFQNRSSKHVDKTEAPCLPDIDREADLDPVTRRQRNKRRPLT